MRDRAEVSAHEQLDVLCPAKTRLECGAMDGRLAELDNLYPDDVAHRKGLVRDAEAFGVKLRGRA